MEFEGSSILEIAWQHCRKILWPGSNQAWARKRLPSAPVGNRSILLPTASLAAVLANTCTGHRTRLKCRPKGSSRSIIPASGPPECTKSWSASQVHCVDHEPGTGIHFVVR